MQFKYRQGSILFSGALAACIVSTADLFKQFINKQKLDQQAGDKRDSACRFVQSVDEVNDESEGKTSDKHELAISPPIVSLSSEKQIDFWSRSFQFSGHVSFHELPQFFDDWSIFFV